MELPTRLGAQYAPKYALWLSSNVKAAEQDAGETKVDVSAPRIVRLEGFIEVVITCHLFMVR